MFVLVRFRLMAYLDLLPSSTFFISGIVEVLIYYLWNTKICFLSSVWYSCRFEDVKYCGILIKIVMDNDIL